MAKTTHPGFDAQQLAEHLRQIHGAFPAGMPEGATQQVMTGFADAYRA